MPPARTVTKDAHALQALSNLSLDSSPFPAFPSFQPMCTLGIIAWEPKGVEKKLADLTVSDILGGLGSARLPVTIQIPQIRGRTFFKSHLPPQRVPNGFPNNPGYVVPLFVAMSRFGVGLDDIDFVLGGSGLHVLATQAIERSNNEPDDTKYLVQRVGNVLLLAKSKSYVQDFSDVGFQFERLVTAGCMEDAHDLTHFESLHIMRIGEFRVLFAAECDAVEYRMHARTPCGIVSAACVHLCICRQGRLRGAGRDQGGEPALLRPEGRVPTSLRACTHARMHGCVHTCLCASMKQVMFQMISSGAEVLVQADKRGKELLGIKRYGCIAWIEACTSAQRAHVHMCTTHTA